MKPEPVVINGQVVTVETDKLAQEAVTTAFNVSQEALQVALELSLDGRMGLTAHEARLTYAAAVTALQLQRREEYQRYEKAAEQGEALLPHTQAMMHLASITAIYPIDIGKATRTWGDNQMFGSPEEKQRAIAFAFWVLLRYVEDQRQFKADPEEDSAYWLLVNSETSLILDKEMDWQAALDRAQALANEKGCAVRAIGASTPPSSVLAYPEVPADFAVKLPY